MRNLRLLQWPFGICCQLFIRHGCHSCQFFFVFFVLFRSNIFRFYSLCCILITQFFEIIISGLYSNEEATLMQNYHLMWLCTSNIVCNMGKVYWRCVFILIGNLHIIMNYSIYRVIEIS